MRRGSEEWGRDGGVHQRSGAEVGVCGGVWTEVGAEEWGGGGGGGEGKEHGGEGWVSVIIQECGER